MEHIQNMEAVAELESVQPGAARRAAREAAERTRIFARKVIFKPTWS